MISICACGRLGFDSALDEDATGSAGMDAPMAGACAGLPDATPLSSSGAAVDAIALHPVLAGYVVLWLEQVSGGAQRELRGIMLDDLGQPVSSSMPGVLLVPANTYVSTFSSSIADDSGALTVTMQLVGAGGDLTFHRYDVSENLQPGGMSELGKQLLLTGTRNQSTIRGNIMLAGKDMMDDVSVLTASAGGTLMSNVALAPSAVTTHVSLERLPNGSAVASWTEAPADGTFRCKLIRVDSDGQPVDASLREVASRACNQGTSMAAQPSGAVGMVWQQQVGATAAAIYFQSFDAELNESGGATTGSSFESLTKATPTVHVEWHEPESGYRVLWIEDDKIMTRLWMPNGIPNPSKQPFVTRPDPIRVMATTQKDGVVAVAWYESNRGVFFTNTCLTPGF